MDTHLLTSAWTSHSTWSLHGPEPKLFIFKQILENVASKYAFDVHEKPYCYWLLHSKELQEKITQKNYIMDTEL